MVYAKKSVFWWLQDEMMQIGEGKKVQKEVEETHQDGSSAI